MLYFTSDLHFGHERIIELCKRPFRDTEEMNRALIENINARVGPEDELWILGDFCHHINREQARAIREQILCRHVHLVEGNHDPDFRDMHIFQSVQPYKELKTERGKLILFHYPIQEWNRAHYGSVHLHGHIHSTGSYNAANRLARLGDRLIMNHRPDDPEQGVRIYDVGVDANGFAPVSLEEIAEILNLR